MLFLIFLGLLASVLSAPAEKPAADPVPIIEQNSNVEPDGNFQWNYESGDGTKQEQKGSLKSPDKAEEEPVASVEGGASWVDPDGKSHELTYVADENGFQPQGDDIPVPPEIPAPIARALEWIAAHPEPEKETKKSNKV